MIMHVLEQALTQADNSTSTSIQVWSTLISKESVEKAVIILDFALMLWGVNAAIIYTYIREGDLCMRGGFYWHKRV